MEYHDRQLCLTFAELTGGDDPVISANTLKSTVQRRNILCVRRGGGEGVQALYAWCTIPEKYKRKWIMKNGDPEEAMRQAAAFMKNGAEPMDSMSTTSFRRRRRALRLMCRK